MYGSPSFEFLFILSNPDNSLECNNTLLHHKPELAGVVVAVALVVEGAAVIVAGADAAGITHIRFYVARLRRIRKHFCSFSSEPVSNLLAHFF